MNDGMQMETLDLRTLRETDARAIAELLCAIWPKAGRTVETRTLEMLKIGRDYRGSEERFPRSFVVREAGRVIAHASAVSRTLGTQHGEMTILALARVCTDPSVRGRKLGQAVVRAVFELIDRGVYPFALFQTSKVVRSFYEQLGAIQVDNQFHNSLGERREASPFWDTVIMRYPTKGNWPSGDIDTRGPGW